jgi:hypothetical protein
VKLLWLTLTTLTLGMIVLTLGVSGSGNTQEPILVRFCDLVKNSHQYSGNSIKVRATYQYGFEWSFLYCLDCKDQEKIWLDLPIDLEDSSEKVLKRLPKGGGIVNITLHGVFEGPGSYGHLNGYKYRFTADKVENMAVVYKGMGPIEKEKAAEEKWACGGANPK